MILRHVGITVTSIEESLKFYGDLLGFEVVRIMDESGEHIDNFSALSGVNVRTVKMKDKLNGMVELLQYHSHPKGPEDRDITHIGCSHFALTVDNLDFTLDKMRKNGYIINSESQYSPDGKVKLTFCKDPDGTLIELVEELD
jgi:catechol 2,3-dioxygenase-like lactoylglutathione lyase family enzyme